MVSVRGWVSLIEAMAHAKPVIATRLGGIPELVEETLVEEGDIQELANALRQYICDLELRKTSGENNQEIVKSFYSARNITEISTLWEESLMREKTQS